MKPISCIWQKSVPRVICFPGMSSTGISGIALCILDVFPIGEESWVRQYFVEGLHWVDVSPRNLGL